MPGADRGSRVRRPLWSFLAVGLALGGIEVALAGETRLGLNGPETWIWVATACVSWGILTLLVGLVLQVAIPPGSRGSQDTRWWPGRRVGVAAVVVLVGASFVIAERTRSPTPPLDRGAEHTSTAPDVLLLTFEEPDPARFLEPGSGPTLDRLIRESGLLEHVRVPPGPVGVALHALMTGETTPGAGRPASGRPPALAYSRTTSSLVELLQGDGYLTGGFTALPLDASLSEWRRAFAVFDDRAGGKRGVSRSVLLDPILRPRSSSSDLVERCLERALCFYRSAASHRVFLWLHLPEAAPGSLGVDATVGRAIAAVEALERLETTLLLVGFLPPPAEGSDGSLPRQGVFLVRHPTLVPPGARVTCVVEMKDVQPTVAELLGNLTRNLGRGLSFGRTLAGGPCPVRRDRAPFPRTPGPGSPSRPVHWGPRAP